MASTRSLAERLAALVDSSGGPCACWPFQGYIGVDVKRGLPGYGQIRDEAPSRKVLKAHRVALILKTGHDCPNMDACHECDNTICCNPDHLFWGTHRYNMLDYVKKYGRLGVSKDRPAPPRPRLPFEETGDHVADAIERLIAQGMFDG